MVSFTVEEDVAQIEILGHDAFCVQVGCEGDELTANLFLLLHRECTLLQVFHQRIGQIFRNEVSCVEESVLAAFDIGHRTCRLNASCQQFFGIFIGSLCLGLPQPSVYDTVGKCGAFEAFHHEGFTLPHHLHYGVASVAVSLYTPVVTFGHCPDMCRVGLVVRMDMYLHLLST